MLHLAHTVVVQVRETGTGMEDEAGYEASLLPVEEAYKRVPFAERRVLAYAWEVYRQTVELNAQLAAQAEAGDLAGNGQMPTAHDEEETQSAAPGRDDQLEEASLEKLRL